LLRGSTRCAMGWLSLAAMLAIAAAIAAAWMSEAGCEITR
jgi:hypothetical protein